ncbi:MAG TPA: hypothetical protein VGH33_12755 [Isosphaeraceae bacterium]|jgi:peptidoglycan/LPS O-acetylase OafA/YrhL
MKPLLYPAFAALAAAVPAAGPVASRAADLVPRVVAPPALTFGLAWASWHGFEKRFVGLKVRPAPAGGSRAEPRGPEIGP